MDRLKTQKTVVVTRKHEHKANTAAKRRESFIEQLERERREAEKANIEAIRA